MARNLETTYAAGLTEGTIMPLRLAMITFTTGIQCAWSGVGTLVWNGMSFLGVGSMGQIGGLSEGVGVQAMGCSVTLSGIDTALLASCLNDIRIGAPVKIWRGLWKQGVGLYGTPYQMFRGQVDKPAFNISGETLAVTLSLESRIVNLQRATFRRYTSQDQALKYPSDTGMAWTSVLNDIALKTGT